MHPRRETKRSPPFLLNSVDRFGRQIAPAVLSVAQEIGARAVPHAEKLLGDPALALSLFEGAAASVSEAIEEKRRIGAPPVRDLAAYLFRTFIRMVDDVKRKERVLEESLRQDTQGLAWSSYGTGVEAALLLDEVMATCDRVTQEVAFLRLEGFSWKEIGTRYGISRHAAEARFSKALDHTRKMLKIRR